jgi:hypoxanthine phosphoribosyltransferase
MHPLITAESISERIGSLGNEIDRSYPDGVHVIGVLKGSFVFLADLVRVLSGPVTVDFITLSSYGRSTKSSGQIQILKDLDDRIEGRDVLLVEDIVDTGQTLRYLVNILQTRNPRRLKTACLLDKPSNRIIKVPIDYVGFKIADVFVVGYGLDYAEHYRNLPYIAVRGKQSE